MTDRKILYQGLSHAAWGYFFLNFNLNLGTVSILPSFVGYILFYLAIEKLAGERRDLALLRPLCILLAVWSALDWLLSWGGGSIDGHALFLDLLAAAAGLYFQFQFLTDMAALAEAYCPYSGLDARLRRRRTAYIVLVTAVSLFSTYPGRFLIRGDDWRTVVMAVLAVVACIISLLVMAALFKLRKIFRASAETV
ncbi:MAG: hypothetical protein K2N78_12155 [Oscillospiraceae bacterium]|nr:hypothetical protein [Oscillospiraceae bacterium]